MVDRQLAHRTMSAGQPTRDHPHHDLEPVEAARFCDLHFIAESLEQVLVDNAICRGKEGENVLDEVFLVLRHLVFPVVRVLAQVNLLCRPEAGLCGCE